ncbi:MAG: bifunctional hydroxymethylpyrimidine kinase/phosphomethylpyrimidine kinase [Actinomycetota bacterium]
MLEAPKPPIALSIAGFDPTGGAGIIQDARTMSACGVWCATVVTAVTVQDTTGVHRIEPLDPDLVRDQIERLMADSNIVAVKTGMLATSEIIEVVAKMIGGIEHVVIDPVLKAGSDGTSLLSDVDALREMLVPRATLITPNAPEAEALTGVEVRSIQGQREAARRLRESGAAAVLVKGGHIAGSSAIDVFDDGAQIVELEAPRVSGANVHGTGCVLSAAITANLAKGLGLRESVTQAKKLVTRSIENAVAIGSGGACAQTAL